MAPHRRLWLLASLSSLAVLAAACGGGSDSTPPPTTYRITGTVGGDVGQGVLVTLSGAASATATTDASGNYSFGGLSGGAYRVTPSLAGYAFNPLSRDVVIAGADATGRDFTATAAAVTRVISGAVSGATTGDVLVTLSGAASGTTQTAADGTYSFSGLLDGGYTVTPSKVGYTFAPSDIGLTVSGADQTGQDFVAISAWVLSGHVTGAAAVTLNLSGGATASTTTDASGNYSFSVAPGSYTVTPVKAGASFVPTSWTGVVSTANVTVPDFAATIDTYSITGTVTGPWIEGITVTLGGATSRTTATDVDGGYAFTGLLDGAYTVAPALTGYGFTPATPAGVTIDGANQVQDFTQASTVTSYSISGNVTYGGTGSGRIYLRAYSATCTNCSAVGGTSISAPGPYAIRGLAAGSYVITARLDSQGFGVENASDPMGTSATVTVGPSATGRDITVTNPAGGTPSICVPTELAAQPGPGTVLLVWNGCYDASGVETATDYQISWGTTTAATDGLITVPARDDAHFIHTGRTNGTATYYRIQSRVRTGPSTWSASGFATVVGPITAGAIPNQTVTPPLSYSIAGAVSFAATATGPLLVAAMDETNGVFRITSLPLPVTSPASYTITGVPAGSYALFAVLDQNQSGTIDDGDVATTGELSAVAIVVAANLTGQNLSLPTGGAVARTTTERVRPASGPDAYSLGNRVASVGRRVVSVTLFAGGNVAVPADVSKDWEFNLWTWLGSTVPTVGDEYRFLVTYHDGTSEILTSSVTGVLSAFASALTETASAPYSPDVPLFSWTAPSPAPAAPWGYSVSLWDGAGFNWWYPDGAPLQATSVEFNADGNSSLSALLSGTTYHWAVTVEDANGNRARREKEYAVP